MKKTLFILLIAISNSFGFANFKNLSNLKPILPEYNKSLELFVGDCSCTGAFVSCSKSCDRSTECSCNCTITSCTCSGCKKISLQPASFEIAFSVSENQYNNFNKLALLVDSEKSENSNNSINLLKNMIDKLSSKEYEDYQIVAKNFEESLKKLSNKTITEINKWLIEIGSENLI